ncbi:MAG TPA: hypothetical protein VF722_08410 [Gemmatimonadaceae bacterium]
MANNKARSDHRAERPSMDYAAAVRLLRQALGPRATLEWPHRREDQPGTEVIVRWTGSDRGPDRLRLVALGAASPMWATEPATTVWVLPRGTAARRSFLRARGESFIDLSGAVHLALPSALIDRTDLRPVPLGASRLGTTTDPFADKSSLVLRVLLDPHALQRAWGVRELATAAEVGVATASDAIRALAARGLVSITRRGRAAEVRTIDPIAVIEAWTRAYDWRLNRGIAVEAPIGDPTRFLRRLPKLLPPTVRWALTLQAGGSLIAPYATWERVHLYVDVPTADPVRELAALATRMGWAPAPNGRLVLLAPYYATSVWHGLRTVRGLPIISDLQLILDLWYYPVRGREQAEHLLRSMISGVPSTHAASHA